MLKSFDRTMVQPEDKLERRTAIGYAQVDTTVSCVITRFRVRSSWLLIPFYLHFRRIRRDARAIKGLLNAAFLLEDRRTCYTLSLWRNDSAILDFGSLRSHVIAGNWAMISTWRKELHRSDIWSAQFKLLAVSSHNLKWEGLDLLAVLADEAQRAQPCQSYAEDGRV